ncbi:uncharacterized protein BO95DRAFT_429549 [Aspergillus brunneoviolaceus CBS 621.78]|uniref:Uncharacterized protein n=1 Tax=Aspergillus brunneoviolaceus CBS 621.78 TaxID=1450534 RepID=A0ACD1GGA9_9EURO|nr:hypothetical protein BO95DRAFT_429549 [Aspergillus brunneoviolaceus CBS 621.78]RAH48154.1 hypothetical protein BO95DRAFT_429549 [Aspergillus brunneoviolaceus CBS 621.78]
MFLASRRDSTFCECYICFESIGELFPTEIFEAQREPRRDLGDQIVDSHVARILDLSKIPNFMCGCDALSIYGAPLQEATERDWVFPDEHITEAIKVFTQAGFLQCPHRSEYERLGKRGLLHNFDDPEPDPLGELDPCPYSVDFHIPDYHFHLSFDSANRNPRAIGYTPTRAIHLYRMPRLFPTFPIPPIGAPPRDDPYYRLTSDDRIRLFSHCDSKWTRGRQSDHAAFHPVKIPQLARWVEVHQLRILRNLPAANTDGEVMGVRWESAPRPHKYMILLVRYQMNVDITELSEPWRTLTALWQEVSPEYDNQKPYPNRRTRRKQMDSDYHKYLYELCINMKRRGELPPPEGERIHPAGLKEFVSWLKMLDIEYNSADLE